MSKYKAIVFDCGGVIFTCLFDKALNYWAMVSGKNISEIKNKFDFDEIFQKLERGEINSTAFRKHALSKLGLKISDEKFDKGWNSIYLDLVPGIKQLLQELKQKHRLVALTNTNEIHAKKWRIMYASILDCFERVFSLNYLRLNPDEVIFLDDNTENVQAASEMNIASIHVTSFK
jgi:putative hydrolase of the HAD superfamily